MQKEKTLPMRKLIQSGTLLGGGGADLLFTQRLRKCFTKKLVFKISQNLGFCVKDF